MHLQEQNWQNLFREHTPEGSAWHGIWTIYSPDKKIIKSYQGVRRFRANQERTVIFHTNNYTYSDGSKEEKNWQLEKATCNHPDGVIHPGLPLMRALSFGEGATACVSKKLEIGKPFGGELFFRYKDWRTSVVSIYGESGSLDRMIHIREHLGSFPEAPPTSEVENLSGNWTGKKQSMTSDLKISPAEVIQGLALPSNQGNNQTLHLPDGIIMHIPTLVKSGEKIEIKGGKLVAPNEYKQLTVNYNESGEFTEFISEIYYCEE